MIRISDLHVALDGKTVLERIEASIPRHGITALIGPNGAGKSTLLHCLAGLTPALQGEVLVDDAPIAQLKPSERARRVALLSQSSPALPRLTVRDLVSFGRWPHHQGRPSSKDDEIVAASLQTFELVPFADRRVETLSGGQRQRAYVAMAHAQSTPWMLLDEPLAALDPRHARDLMERLHALSRPGPEARGVVVVIHDLGMAARYADWVVSLRQGRLVQSAARKQAMTSDHISQLFDTRLRVAEFEGHSIVLHD